MTVAYYALRMKPNAIRPGEWFDVRTGFTFTDSSKVRHYLTPERATDDAAEFCLENVVECVPFVKQP